MLVERRAIDHLQVCDKARISEKGFLLVRIYRPYISSEATFCWSCAKEDFWNRVLVGTPPVECRGLSTRSIDYWVRLLFVSGVWV